MRHELYGFGGWLLFFVIILAGVTPLVEIVSVYSALYGGQSDFLRPVITNWSGFSLALWSLVAFECGLFGYTGYRLVRDYRPSTIRLARITIWISGLILPSFGILLTGMFVDYPILDTYSLTFAEGPFEIIRPIIWAGIWTLYFAKSERVRITYLTSAEDAELDEVFQ
jgi:uncharacterized protein DUF2569